ncbi:hypothetical protein ABZ807_22300 [Micromonospora sp. NPDC047548]|uniref:GNAT family N-acetyltransferase n=1 Tax=Micromonospora sp. NPDC047548 TaxID=3155624 RepID=UPI0033FFACB9
MHRVTGLVTGGIGFFGPPDADGKVELGYGVAPKVKGCGYAKHDSECGGARTCSARYVVTGEKAIAQA